MELWKRKERQLIKHECDNAPTKLILLPLTTFLRCFCIDPLTATNYCFHFSHCFFNGGDEVILSTVCSVFELLALEFGSHLKCVLFMRPYPAGIMVLLTQFDLFYM
ncbi:hypothetical protein Pfo_006915 [Paulownia fortunei]|nr:hypothetical protein Pfo_006915 [Paulownia fortunei]